MTMTRIMTIAEAVEKTRESVITGPWSQQEGDEIPDNWRHMDLNDPELECCVGTKLYMHFYQDKVDSPLSNPSTPSIWLAGIDAFAASIGGNRAHMILMFREFCPDQDPFSGVSWKVTREEAWDRLSKIDRLPSLCGADLSRTNLSYADLSYTDLSRVNLRGAIMKRSVLRGINGTQGDFSYAFLGNADFSGADLRQARLVHTRGKHVNFTSTIMHHAYLHGASLNYADLSEAELAYAEMEHVVLSHAKLHETDLYRTNLSFAGLYKADFSRASMIDTKLDYAVGWDTVIKTDIQTELVKLN